MPYPFTLPTTSPLSFPSSFSSPTHPSLPQQASNQRAVLKSALSSFRSSNTSNTTNLTAVESALESYIPYLLALERGLLRQTVAGEEVDVLFEREVAAAWRPIVGDAGAGAAARRKKQRVLGLDAEVAFVLGTAAAARCLRAREACRPGLGGEGDRAGAMGAAAKNYLAAYGIHRYLLARSSAGIPAPPGDEPQQTQQKQQQPVDIRPETQTALADLAYAEANLLAVAKDDPYPALVAQLRDKADKEWMIKGAEISSVRAHLFARVCVESGERCRRAGGLFGRSSGVEPDLVKYTRDLGRMARARACRMLGVDAERDGDVAMGIAWVRAARMELSGGKADVKEVEAGKGLSSGLGRFKKEWKERKEDRRAEKGKEWGLDGGRAEEGRVLDLLEEKWVKLNDTINTRPIPPVSAVMPKLPTGREFYSNPPMYDPPSLDESTLAALRAPPSPRARGEDGHSSDSSDDEETGGPSVVGAFPSERNDQQSRAYY